MKKVAILLVTILLIASACTLCACDNDFPMEKDMSVNLEQEIGIYFFGDDVEDYVRYSKDLSAKYFDKNKPTAVYFHGLSSNPREDGEVYNFGLYTSEPLIKKGIEMVDYVKKFKAAGYNVCIMDYCHYASNLIKLAEYIWVGLEGGHSVACTFAKELADCFKGYDQELRFFGHSYGAQSSIATAYLLYAMHDNGLVGEECLPKRLSIADPYFGDVGLMIEDNFTTNNMENTNEAINGRTPAEVVADKMEYLNGNGVTIDLYCAMPLAYDQFLYSEPEKRESCANKIKANSVWTVLVGCQNEFGKIGDIHVVAESWMFESFFASVKMDGDKYMPTTALDTTHMRELVGRQFESTYEGFDLEKEVIIEVFPQVGE